MAESSVLPAVLVVADPARTGELVAALSELPGVEVLVSSGGDDTIDLFAARRPAAVVLTASLEVGDTRSLIAALRAMVPRAEVAIVVVGDETGPIRTALDALDLAPDRFVTRPLSAKALRFAVSGGMDTVRIVRGGPAKPGVTPGRPGVLGVARGTRPGKAEPGATMRLVPPVPSLRPTNRGIPVSSPDGAERRPASQPVVPATSSPPSATDEGTARAAQRARWEALADSLSDEDADDDHEVVDAADVGEASAAEPAAGAADAHTAEASAAGAADAADAHGSTEGSGPARGAAGAAEAEGSGPARGAVGAAAVELPVQSRAATRELADDSAPLPPPLVIKPRRQKTESSVDEPAPVGARRPGTTDEIAPPREPTLIIHDPGRASMPAVAAPPELPRTQTGDGQVVVAARTSSDELWSDPVSIPAMLDREPRTDGDDSGEIGGRDFDGLGSPFDEGDAPAEQVADGDELSRPERAGSAFEDEAPPPADPSAGPISTEPSGTIATARDFARELRAKMSMMAQRLFQGTDVPPPGPADHAPRHDHHTEIDLASLGDDQPLGGELEARPGSGEHEVMAAAGSPSSWDTQVRERGLPDAGMIMRGVSDAAMLLARMFAQGATGRVGFRRDEVETIVFFDHGRPVFASSNEPLDRMGELLLREGKITASQYERCQTVVAESGRRMGEILVDFGYLKRRELLPAVRRHVEDIVYSLFGWERGAYAITLEAQPSGERIRLSRHPASLILEGIRRKLDRSSLERLIGPMSTVVEVRDRERLGGIINLGDLAGEERAALAAFDGQADLAQVARTTGVDLADVLPLAWGLCVLGLATARRTDTEVPDEAAALVGETDLAIDRERVRARWQLVTDADYFALLGVRRDATGFEIRRAYQSARRDFAADCFPSELRRELARELDDIAHVLDEAFRVLRDDRLRQTYLANLVDR